MTTTTARERTERIEIDRKAITRLLKERGEGRTVVFDTVCDGLSLIVGARSATWFFVYRPRGVDHAGKRFSQRRVKLGNQLTHTPGEARVAADALRDEVVLGADPREEKKKAERQAVIERARRSTISEQAETYIKAELNSGSRYHYDEAGHLRRGIAELELGDSDPSALTLPDIKRLLAMHRDRPATARHRYGSMSRFLDWLMDDELIEQNPAKSVSRKKRPKPAKPRTKYPTATQMQMLWNKADDLIGVERDFLRGLMVVPLRMTAMAELRPSNWDSKRSAIVLHHLQTKNRDAFTLPVGAAAAEIIGRRLDAMKGEDRQADGRLFQLSSAEGEPMKAWSGFLKRIRTTTGVANFGFHDLRRAFSTELAEHDAGNADLADALLNHKASETSGGMKGVYQLARWFEPKRKLMAEWERLVSHAVKKGIWPREAKGAKGNVVPLRKRAK